jgi:Omp85 superfamily domain
MNLFPTKIIILFYFLFLISTKSFASHSPLFPEDAAALTKKDSTKKAKRYKILGLPLFFYVPETKFGGGAAGLVTFHFKKDSLNTRPSSVQFGLAYTQLKQTLVYLPFNLWMKNEKYNVFGEIGYYRYNFFFWGVGNKQAFRNQELYDVVFPRIKFNALQRIYKNTYTGIKYNFDDFKVTRVDSFGILDAGEVVGARGGVVSSIGAVLKHDSRDNLFNASKGYFAELSFQVDNKAWGSSFNNTRVIFDGATYFTTKFKHTIALNTYAVYGVGDIPFNQMAMLGGTRKMRGFYEGRYRDNNLVMLQAEYRAPLFWRLGAVAFVTAADVANKVSDFKVADFKLAVGGGLRVMIDKKQKINVRLDVGWADPKPNFYLTVTEAF